MIFAVKGLSPEAPSRFPKGEKNVGERENTEARILDAVGTILSRKGFRYLGVNAIAREACVDKVLIYRYFGGLQPLLRTFFTRRKYWPTTSEILETAGEGEADPATRAYAILRGYLRELKKSDAAREVLRGEIAGREDVASETAEERYRPGMALLDLLREPDKETEGLTEMAAPLCGIHSLAAAKGILPVSRARPAERGDVGATGESHTPSCEVVLQGKAPPEG